MCCFAGDTQIKLANGQYKCIKDVQVGDEIKGSKGTNKVEKVLKPFLHFRKKYSINKGKFFTTAEHPFKTTEGWKAIKPYKRLWDPETWDNWFHDHKDLENMTELKVGDTIITEKGQTKIKNISSNWNPLNWFENVYNLQLDNDNTYYADDYLVHNKGGGIGGLIGSIFDKVKKLVGKVFNAITSPFGVNIDVPDYDIGVDMESQITGVLVTKDSATANIPVVYGKRMVGATRVFVEAGTGDQAKYLYVAYVLCEGPINGVTKIMLDDKDTGISAGDLVHGADPISPSGGIKDFQGRAQFQFFDGRNNKNGIGAQVASSLLRGINTGSWTVNHKLEGVAYIAARFEWIEGTTQDEVNANPFLGNVPNLIAEIEGKKIFDAKTLTSSHSTAYDSETITFTNNPVSCLLDYMRNPVYGKGLTNDDFSYASWDTAAHLCDQDTTYTGIPFVGTREASNYDNTPAFSTNYVLDTGISLMSNTKILCAAFRGIMPYQGGKYQLQIEHGGDDTDIYATPASPTTVMTVTNDHIVGGMAIDGENKLSKVNRVRLIYVNPNEDYQPDEVVFPESGSSLDTSMLAEDNGIRLEKRLSVPFCTSKAQAEQYGAVFLKKSRTQKLITFATNLATSNLAVGDLIRVINEHLSFDGVVRVMDIKVSTAGAIEISAVEHQSSHYGIGASGKEYIKPVLNLPDPTTCQPVTNLTAENKTI